MYNVDIMEDYVGNENEITLFYARKINMTFLWTSLNLGLVNSLAPERS